MFTQSQVSDVFDLMALNATSESSEMIGGPKVIFSVVDETCEKQSLDILHARIDNQEEVFRHVRAEESGYLFVLIQADSRETEAHIWNGLVDRLIVAPQSYVQLAESTAKATGHTLAAIGYHIGCDSGGEKPFHHHSSLLATDPSIVPDDIQWPEVPGDIV